MATNNVGRPDQAVSFLVDKPALGITLNPRAGHREIADISNDVALQSPGETELMIKGAIKAAFCVALIVLGALVLANPVGVGLAASLATLAIWAGAILLIDALMDLKRWSVIASGEKDSVNLDAFDKRAETFVRTGRSVKDQERRFEAKQKLEGMFRKETTEMRSLLNKWADEEKVIDLLVKYPRITNVATLKAAEKKAKRAPAAAPAAAPVRGHLSAAALAASAASSETASDFSFATHSSADTNVSNDEAFA